MTDSQQSQPAVLLHNLSLALQVSKGTGIKSASLGQPRPGDKRGKYALLAPSLYKQSLTYALRLSRSERGIQAENCSLYSRHFSTSKRKSMSHTVLPSSLETCLPDCLQSLGDSVTIWYLLSYRKYSF